MGVEYISQLEEQNTLRCFEDDGKEMNPYPTKPTPNNPTKAKDKKKKKKQQKTKQKYSKINIITIIQ